MISTVVPGKLLTSTYVPVSAPKKTDLPTFGLPTSTTVGAPEATGVAEGVWLWHVAKSDSLLLGGLHAHPRREAAADRDLLATGAHDDRTRGERRYALHLGSLIDPEADSVRTGAVVIDRKNHELVSATCRGERSDRLDPATAAIAPTPAARAARTMSPSPWHPVTYRSCLVPKSALVHCLT